VTVSNTIKIPALFPEKEAARLLEISVSTLVRLRKSGAIKAKKIGNRWKYREDWLLEFLDKEDNPCKTFSESESISSVRDQTAPSGVHAGTTHKLDRHAAHLSAQKILKKPKSGLPNS
jgi:excisionase family DNA binding protein